MAVTQTLTGPELRAWREAHGWYPKDFARQLGCWGYATVKQWEFELRPIPPSVAAWVAAHPAPAARERYRLTPDGLRKAIRQWSTHAAWCRWWGVRYASLCRWLNGTYALPVPVRAWLRAGAPTNWVAKGVAGAGGCRPPVMAGGPIPMEPATKPGLRRWRHLDGVGWTPPEGYCDPLKDVLQLPGCQQCGYREDCVAMFGNRAG